MARSIIITGRDAFASLANEMGLYAWAVGDELFQSADPHKAQTHVWRTRKLRGLRSIETRLTINDRDLALRAHEGLYPIFGEWFRGSRDDLALEERRVRGRLMQWVRR